MMPSNSTEYNKQYRQKNKERLREIRGKWYYDNAEKMREYRRRYFQEHKDKWREYWKKRTKKYYYQQLEEENRNLRYELDKFSEAFNINKEKIRIDQELLEDDERFEFYQEFFKKNNVL